MAGMLYQPKYRNAAGKLVKSSKWWFKIYVNGKPVRANSRTVKYWRRPWLQALLKAGLAVREGNADGTPKKGGKIFPGVMPHDFRRTAIRNLSIAGVSEAIGMALCGHETRSIYDRYRIVTGDDLRGAVAKLEGVAVKPTSTVDVWCR